MYCTLPFPPTLYTSAARDSTSVSRDTYTHTPPPSPQRGGGEDTGKTHRGRLTSHTCHSSDLSSLWLLHQSILIRRFFHNLVLHGSGAHEREDYVRWAIDLVTMTYSSAFNLTGPPLAFS
eukprot:COSAG06_NODE_14_length_35011_cov_20.984132_8_plen_120_part_00